ncbi:MAG: GGDEF domain-containing protein, partial [Alphaproteobacteria bacterium]|nr:GGDEF domain-containing protein [Candidatus Nitrobium versatile]
YACRYGGEEFVVLLPETGLESARQRAEQLRERIKGMRIPYQGRMLDPVTLSLGIAVYPKDGKSAVELLRAADSALYRAKAEGRDRVATV